MTCKMQGQRPLQKRDCDPLFQLQNSAQSSGFLNSKTLRMGGLKGLGNMTFRVWLFLRASLALAY